MMRLLPTVLLFILFCSPASAGKNAGGALVVHTVDGFYNTIFEPPDWYCDYYEGLPLETCNDLVHQSDYVDPNFLIAANIWLIASFSENSSPGVSVIYFGIEHNFLPGFLGAWTLCAPENSLEIPDAGWPNDWENAGNTVAFGAPIAGDRLFPFYWFAAYGDVGNIIGTRINPTGGYAAFVSDDNPGVLDEIHLFGQVRWFEPGYNQCPDATVLACCFADGHCEELTPFDCEAVGGSVADFDSCDPNPCPQPERVCCIAEECFLQTEGECLASDGIWFPDEESCEGFECPPVAVEETTWGTIRANYR